MSTTFFTIAWLFTLSISTCNASRSIGRMIAKRNVSSCKYVNYSRLLEPNETRSISINPLNYYRDIPSIRIQEPTPRNESLLFPIIRRRDSLGRDLLMPNTRPLVSQQSHDMHQAAPRQDPSDGSLVSVVLGGILFVAIVWIILAVVGRISQTNHHINNPK